MLTIVDTGAKISYLPRELRDGENYESAGRDGDFHPLFGNWQTDIVKVRCSLGDSTGPTGELDVLFGELPQQLKVAMGNPIVIGSDLFRRYDERLVFDFPQKKMYFWHTQ